MALIIGVDFDGTMVEHKYPQMGKPVPYAIDTLKQAQQKGARVILWTMRDKLKLREAKEYMEDNGIILFGVNENPEQFDWTSSPKAYCHTYIDDAALGCPLVYPEGGRPYVDWLAVAPILMKLIQ